MMRILFISPWFPSPPVNGSKLRIYNLLRALSTKHSVHMLSFVRNGEAVDFAGVEGVCQTFSTVRYREFNPTGVRALLGFFSPTPRSLVDTYSKEMARSVKAMTVYMDVVVANELVTAPYVCHAGRGKWIFDDLEIATGRDAFLQESGFRHLRRQLAWQKTKAYVRRLLPKFTATTVVSRVERDIVEEIMPGYPSIKEIPNGVDVNYHHPGIANPVLGRMVYSGALTYSANYDAMQYFLAEIFPLIRYHNPEVSLDITGSTDGVDLSKLRLVEGVNLTGFVDDIRPVVAGAWACVVPLRQGGGTRLKILEAMALGTPVVATSKGAEGLDVTPEKDILIADQPGDFVRQVIRLLGDAELRFRLVVNARRLVEQSYSWDLIGKDFCDLVEGVVGL
jgi:glycosyltransferase involved in cell wall biosynthesis